MSQNQYLPEYETQFGHSPLSNRAVPQIPDTATLRIESHLSTTPRVVSPGLQPILAYAGPPFELTQEIGRGGHGVIYKAVQNSLGRIVAIKQLREDVYEQAIKETGEGEWLEQIFRQEAITTALLEHPNIVPIHDITVAADGRPQLALKLIRGNTWDTLINRDTNMPLADFLARHLPILISMAHAVAFAHSRGIVHRDLKPHQVMVGEFGEVLLMDWGLALAYDKPLLESATGRAELSATIPTRGTAESPAGSPAFMAPEQAEPTALNVGPWTDVFLLGATLYTLLTGVPPHRLQGLNTTAQMLTVVGKCQIVSPADRAPDLKLPEQLVNLCNAAMAQEPNERLQSADAFINELQDYLSGSSRRRESQALTAGVHQDLASDPTRYDNLSACDNRLDHALSLWPENPEARWLRFRLLFRFAQVAMSHGDIQLARIQAERLPPSPERDELLAEVSVFEKLKDREQLEAETAELERRLAVANAMRLRTQLSGATKVMEHLAAANPGDDEALTSLIRDAQQWLQAKQSE